MWVFGLPILVVFILYMAGSVGVACVVFSRWCSLNRRQRLHSITVFAAFMVFTVGLANFAVFLIVGSAIGGDALTGKVEEGRYYVSDHGRVTEVSQDVWVYSYYHAKSIWITHPLVALAATVIIFSRRWFGIQSPSLTITIAPDGAIIVDGKKITIEQAIAKAESAKFLREPIYVKREYPPAEAPLDAVRFYEELIGHGILTQQVDQEGTTKF